MTLEMIVARTVKAKDRALDGSVGGAQRRETMLFLHVLRNF